MVNGNPATNMRHREVVKAIKAGGQHLTVVVRYGSLVTVCTVGRQPGQGFGFNLSRRGKKHVLSRVEPGGGADKAGLSSGDIVVAVNGVLYGARFLAEICTRGYH
jgi:predicted metalloprotease with PDZ domain